jgi:ABC-type transport system substrate-binding protein
LLQAGGALGAGAAAVSLIGCGGGSGESDGDPSGLLHRPVDTSNRAVKGGVLPLQGGVVSFDFNRSATENGPTALTYSRILKFQTYKYPEPAQLGLLGDAATSWEISPDGLSYTFKTRPNMKFDPRPPTSGRVMTSADIKFTWDFWAKNAIARTALSNAADPTAPVQSVSTPDANTAVFHLAFPYAPLLPLLAFYKYLQVIPQEADGKYDYKNDMRGTGTWRLKEWVQEARTVWEKNPDWYDANKVYLDGVTYYEVGEYSAALAQFRSGALATMPTLRQEDVLPTKRDLPALLMMPEEVFDRTAQWIRFGYNDGSPFRDERIRRAMSMMTDRDLFIDVFGNVSQFRDAGLEVPTAWHTAFGAGEVWWLDPKDEKNFGENAKWYKHDPAEARKLATAAGYANGFDSQYTISESGPGGADGKIAEVLIGMWGEGGLFRFKLNYPANLAAFRSGWHYNYNRHEGVAMGGGGADYPDIDQNLQVNYKYGQDRTGHVDADGKPDAYLEDIIVKQRTETDVNRRKELLNDFQRHFAGKQYVLYEPGDSLGFLLAQPWFGNWRAFTSLKDGAELTEAGVHYWIDESKKT